MLLSSVLLVVTLAAPVGPSSRALAADLDGDGRPEAMTAWFAAERDRAFFSIQGEAPAGVPATSPLYPAWQALPARFAGEDRDALVLGVWTTKRTRPGDPPRKSIWVVGVADGRWVDRWRGSGLQREIDDYAIADLDGDGAAELIVRECGGERPGFTAYAWQGFGFGGRGRLAAPCTGLPIAANKLRLNGGTLWLED